MDLIFSSKNNNNNNNSNKKKKAKMKTVRVTAKWHRLDTKG